jgi:hypothetical protein
MLSLRLGRAVARTGAFTAQAFPSGQLSELKVLDVRLQTSSGFFETVHLRQLRL